MARKHGSSRIPFDIAQLAAKRRWSPEEARELFVAHRGSGSSLSAFARRHALELKRLYWWRQRLKGEALRPAQRPVRFLPVRVRVSAAAPAGVEVLLRGGRRIRRRTSRRAARG